MVGRVVEIETDGRHLAINRGFLVVSEHGTEVGKVPLDDIAAVLANAHGLTHSNNALVTLSRRGVRVVLCGANHMPAAIVWPVDSHHVQTGRMNDQVAAGVPLKKRLWAQLPRKNSGAGRDTCRRWRTPCRLLSPVAQGPLRRSGQCGGRGSATLLAAFVRGRVPA